jgi:hypothetical protein
MVVITIALTLLSSAWQVRDVPRTAKPVEGARQRLAAYEQQVAAGKADPAILGAIAAAVLEGNAASTNPIAMTEACASDFAKHADCSVKLWALARRSNAPLVDRARAAAVLVRAKDKDAPQYVLDLAAKATRPQLVSIAPALAVLPPDASLPLLLPLLNSPDPAEMTTACRLMSDIDARETRQAIQAFLVTVPRGTQPWFACVLAAARLGDPEAQQTSRSITTYLGGLDLVAAADVVQSTDQELAVSLLLQATRQARGVVRLEAADRLVSLRPEVASNIVAETLRETDPELRAAALLVHRHLKIEPGPDVRALMLDSDAGVRLRAAEAVLDWVARQEDRAGIPHPPPRA